MNKVSNKKQIPFQIKNIEILDINLNSPGQIVKEIKTYHYNINIQHRINENNRLIFVDTSIEVLHQDKKTKMGFLKVTCVYFVENLLDFKSSGDNKLFDLPDTFVNTINTISISTTRGIMFSQFRGTYLHNAILPIIDPIGFKADNPPPPSNFPE